MDIIAVILTVVGAYSIFMVIAYVFARILFPTLKVDEESEPTENMKGKSIQRLSGKIEGTKKT